MEGVLGVAMVHRESEVVFTIVMVWNDPHSGRRVVLERAEG